MDPAQALSLKLMNANKTADGDRRAASGLTEQHPVAVEQQQGGSNKNNTMVETVVRASMRFES